MLALLAPLSELQALWLGRGEWLQKGPLAKCWMGEERSGTLVERRGPGQEDSLWGEEAWPRPLWPWRADTEVRKEALRMKGAPLREDEVRAHLRQWMRFFADEVDGTTGARAFFAFIAPRLSSSSSSSYDASSAKKRRVAEDEGGEVQQHCSCGLLVACSCPAIHSHACSARYRATLSIQALLLLLAHPIFATTFHLRRSHHTPALSTLATA